MASCRVEVSMLSSDTKIGGYGIFLRSLEELKGVSQIIWRERAIVGRLIGSCMLWTSPVHL